MTVNLGADLGQVRQPRTLMNATASPFILPQNQTQPQPHRLHRRTPAQTRDSGVK